MATKRRLVSTRLSPDHQKMINEIVRRTGETRVDLFERIVAQEHKRITNEESSSQSQAGNVDSIAQSIRDLVPLLKETSKNTKESLNAAASIYSGTLFTLKELFRSISISAACFSNTSLLRSDQLSIITKEADDEATTKFADAFKMLRDLKANDLFSILLKKSGNERTN